ncbi:unnamed protein product [Mytilus edulis]|uniref:Endonuclease/exonuclease/phosphatase domain-containing protein n=1 Tax=Mytilus edulis TaxID=6550 RepID=A0A8S3TE99_MYTED|nr:unnamed protein product [Mytilus edulis]
MACIFRVFIYTWIFGTSIGYTWIFGTSIGYTWIFGTSIGYTWIFGTSIGYTWIFGTSIGYTWIFGTSIGYTWTFGTSIGYTWIFGTSIGYTWIFGTSIGYTWIFGTSIGLMSTLMGGLYQEKVFFYHVKQDNLNASILVVSDNGTIKLNNTLNDYPEGSVITFRIFCVDTGVKQDSTSIKILIPITTKVPSVVVVQGFVYIGGDVNSRFGSEQDYIQGVDDINDREIIDFSSNKYGDLLIDFLTSCNLCMLNGRADGNNDFTCVSKRGRSVVDYVFTPYEQLDMCTSCDVYLVSDLIVDTGLNFEKSIPDHGPIVWTVNVKKDIACDTSNIDKHQIQIDPDWVKENNHVFPTRNCDTLNALLRQEDVNDAVNRIKLNKAVGFDYIPAENLRNSICIDYD